MKKKDNRKNMNRSMKQSVVMGGMIGTAGLFIAKLLGLLYSIPLSSILGSDALMSYYGTAYQIYSYVLNIFTAGIPFAISTIVAKYTTLEDYKSLLKVKKISLRIMSILGFLGMIILMLFSGLIASLVAVTKDIPIMRTTIIILALAIFFVPILSAYRGFWQGRKEMSEYAFSQAFEQFVRVGFLLSMAYLLVYVLHMERKYALYAAVLSTSVAAIAGIAQIHYFDRKHIGEIKGPASQQTKRAVGMRKLFKELIALAIPYLLTAVIGYIDNVFNSILLPVGLRLHNYSSDEVSVILSAVNYAGSKLTSIPQILAPGFVAAMIPHVTQALTEHDEDSIKKIVKECLGIVLFIGSFLSIIIAVYASDIYHILFYTSNPELSASVIRWIAIEGFLGTICPVSSSLMIALGLKKDVLKRQMYSAIIKGVTMVPLIYFIGYRGAVVSSILGNVFVFAGNIRQISSTFHVNLGVIYKNTGKIILALAIMWAVSYGLRMIGISGDEGRKIVAFGKLCVNGLVSMFVYFGVTHLLKVPQQMFNRDIISLVKNRVHHA